MRSLVIILSVAFLFSCKNEDKVPDYVIPPEDMANIILDIHLTDGMLTINDVRRNLVNADTVNYYDAIFEEYGYERHAFDTSVYYYSKNINQYDKIYEDVLNRLNEMETLLKEDEPEKTNKEGEKEPE